MLGTVFIPVHLGGAGLEATFLSFLDDDAGFGEVVLAGQHGSHDQGIGLGVDDIAAGSLPLGQLFIGDAAILGVQEEIGHLADDNGVNIHQVGVPVCRVLTKAEIHALIRYFLPDAGVEGLAGQRVVLGRLA